MVWDLQGAMLKKQEVETSRLLDCEFRERVRTMRLLAPLLDPSVQPGAFAAQVARGDDKSILAELAAAYPDQADNLADLFSSCRSEARKQLIAERGDPSPYRFL